MDAFGDDNFGSPAEVDPAAEFLAREQDQLAGLEDELEPIAAAVKPELVESFDSEPIKAENVSEDFSSAPEDTFEVIDAPPVASYDSYPDPESDFFGAAEPEAPLSDDQEADIVEDAEEEPAVPIPKVVKEEPEKIRKWREEQKMRLEDKDVAEELAIEKLRKQAAEELAEWTKNHNESIAKTRAANRNAEKQFVAETDEIEPGTEWERIAKLCDFNPKSNKSSKDVSRMRSIILQLKQTPLPSKE